MAACRPPGPRPAAATHFLVPVRPRPPMPSSTTTTPPSPSWPRRPEWPATRPPPWPPSSSTHRHRRTGWVRRLTACGPTCSSPALFLEDILHQEIILHCYATTSSATTTQLYVLVYTVLSKLSLPDLFDKLYTNQQDSLDPIIPKGTLFAKPSIVPVKPNGSFDIIPNGFSNIVDYIGFNLIAYA